MNYYYSSSGLRLDSQLDAFSRLERYQYLAANPQSLNALRVCYETDNIPDGAINCGKCKKCVRTRMELLTAGLSSSTFPTGELNADEVKAIDVSSVHEIEFALEPVKRLREIGRSDITSILEGAVEKYRRKSRRKNLRRQIRTVDETHLGQIVSKSYRALKRLTRLEVRTLARQSGEPGGMAG